MTAEAVNDFIHKRKGASGRTKNNYIQALNVLFEYARKQGYVVRDFDLMDRVETAAEEDFEIEIFTPQEFKLLVARCPDSLAPVLVLGAFAGLRTAEIERLDWSEVNLGGKFIEMKAKKAKTRARRLVPIVPALEAGNSPDIIFQHYREVVTADTAKEWVCVTPALIEAEARELGEEGARLRAARAEVTSGREACGSAGTSPQQRRSNRHGRRRGGRAGWL